MIHRSRMRSLGLPLVAGMALMTVLLPALAAAQEGLGRGRVSGDVRDEAGEAIEGVLVTAQHLAANVKFEAKTNKKGHFAIAGFGTGVWRFTAVKEGYLAVTLDRQINQLKANDPIDIVMKKAEGLEALQSDKSGLEVFDKGNALLAEERYDEAIAAFEEFVAKYPEVYHARLNIATACLKKGDLARAETEYGLVLQSALPADPGANKDDASAIRALSGLGEIALKKSDFDAASKHFAKALEISPQDEAAAYNVGEIFFSNQKNDEAIQYFDLSIKINPKWAKPYYRLGLVHLNKGDFPKAIENLNKFLELDPENPEAPNVRNIIASLEKMKK